MLPILFPIPSFISQETALVEENISACFFEIDANAQTEEASCSLMVLYKKNFYDFKSVFMGELIVDERSSLCFRLYNLKNKLRIYHTDEKYAFRYFLDNTYDAAEMSGNYILIKKEGEHIDFYISN